MFVIFKASRHIVIVVKKFLKTASCFICSLVSIFCFMVFLELIFNFLSVLRNGKVKNGSVWLTSTITTMRWAELLNGGLPIILKKVCPVNSTKVIFEFSHSTNLCCSKPNRHDEEHFIEHRKAKKTLENFTNTEAFCLLLQSSRQTLEVQIKKLF